MDIFIRIVAVLLRLCLCVFVLRSQFALQLPALLKRFLILGSAAVVTVVIGVWAAHFAVDAALFAALAAVLCLSLTTASIAETVLFSLALGLLQLLVYWISLFIRQALSAGLAAQILIESILLFAGCAIGSAMGKRWRNGAVPILWLIPVWLVAVVLCAEVVRTEGASLAATLFSCLWLPYSGARLWDVGNRVDEQVRRQMEQQQKAHHYAQQEVYFLQLQEKQNQTRALWHDLNKYLKAAKAEYPTAPALDRLEASLSDATQITDVGNRVLNVILNEYALTAKAAMISLRLKVQVPPQLAVAVADLYVLIGNTMDNAIEACRALPPDQRMIELTLRTHYDVLYYKVVNPYDPRVRRQEDPMRGYGLQNVRRCVDQYSGSMEITEQNGFFILTAHLNM